jgi:hypothetical protein
MWLARFKDAVFNKVIEVATDSGRGKGETFADSNRCRWAVFEHDAGYRVTGAELIDFHNSSVS